MRTFFQIASLRKQVEALQSSLTNSREENDHLNQRLTMTLSRINILKTTNQVRSSFSHPNLISVFLIRSETY